MSNIGTKFNLANRFTFDPNTNSLTDKESDNEVIRLGSNESRILLLLAEKPNEVVSRNELHDFVWREQGFEVDDSSLTQAISTLRKLLQDSTKSPQYVKTVPKRGYQLICPVERALPQVTRDDLDEMDDSQDANVAGFDTNESATASLSQTVDTTAGTVDTKKPKTNNKPLMMVLLVITVMLPILAILLAKPAQTQFRELTVVDSTPVRTPLNHPDLSVWMPSIEQCVKRYNETRQGDLAPVEVIATGGQNNQLVLNYIHSLQQSGENITLRIVAEQDDLSRVCQ